MDRTLFIALAVCFVAGALSAEVGVFVDKQEASEFLKRGKRANQPFEEFLQGNWERECVEEQCDYEEVREVYENDDQAAEAWKGLWHQCTYPSEPCSSPGTAECENQYSDHVCHCRSGFTGSTCATDINECDEADSCPVRSSCVNTVGSYHCECDYGFTGPTCSEDINECLSTDVCANGFCINEPGSFRCVCQNGYTGTNCDEDVNECILYANLCHNGGECVNAAGSYLCDCTSAWTGIDCSQDVNECAEDDPCVHGSCVNEIGTYHCACDAGFAGTHCDQDVDECALGHCPEGTECVDGTNRFTCVCPDAGCQAAQSNQVQQQEHP